MLFKENINLRMDNAQRMKTDHNSSFFLSLYTARPSYEYYQQVYFVHSGLQDESLQVTISKLPKGSLTCTGGDFPCTGDI